MSEYKTPSEEQLKLIKRQFTDLSHLDAIMLNESGGRISPSHLFSYVNGDIIDDPEIETALRTDLNLRRVYRDMLQKAAAYYVPEAMAASSDEWPVREGKGCRIRLEPSRAEPDQIYVIIELTGDDRNAASVLVVCDTESNCSRFDLPSVRDGVAQIITTRSSDLVRLLTDPKTEAFIR